MFGRVRVVRYEHMFGTAHGTLDHTFERECAAVVDEVLAIREQQAQLDQRLTEISRRADDRGYWKAAGCSSLAQWLAQITSSDYRAARRLAETAEALRELPALDQAFRDGDLTLDQVAAAAPFATPASDAEIARVAVGKAPSAISLAARAIVPPTVADDQTLYKRRALRMTWRDGGRELVFSGQLPLEHGAAFEQAIRDLAKTQRAADKQHGTILDWQQSTADALVTLARHGRRLRRGRRAAPQPDDADRAPQRRRSADARRRRADQPRDRRATRMRRPPAHHQAQRSRSRALTRRTLRLLPPTARALQALRRPLPIPRLHRHPRPRSTPPHSPSNTAAQPTSPT